MVARLANETSGHRHLTRVLHSASGDRRAALALQIAENNRTDRCHAGTRMHMIAREFGNRRDQLDMEQIVGGHDHDAVSAAAQGAKPRDIQIHIAPLRRVVPIAISV
jgi:hypothetical protein